MDIATLKRLIKAHEDAALTNEATPQCLVSLKDYLDSLLSKNISEVSWEEFIFDMSATDRESLVFASENIKQLFATFEILDKKYINNNNSAAQTLDDFTNAIPAVKKAKTENVDTAFDLLNLEGVPPEVRARVMENLDATDLKNLSMTSKLFYSETQQLQVWYDKFLELGVRKELLDRYKTTINNPPRLYASIQRYRRANRIYDKTKNTIAPNSYLELALLDGNLQAIKEHLQTQGFKLDEYLCEDGNSTLELSLFNSDLSVAEHILNEIKNGSFNDLYFNRNYHQPELWIKIISRIIIGGNVSGLALLLDWLDANNYLTFNDLSNYFKNQYKLVELEESYNVPSLYSCIFGTSNSKMIKYALARFRNTMPEDAFEITQKRFFDHMARAERTGSIVGIKYLKELFQDLAYYRTYLVYNFFPTNYSPSIFERVISSNNLSAVNYLLQEMTSVLEDNNTMKQKLDNALIYMLDDVINLSDHEKLPRIRMILTLAKEINATMNNLSSEFLILEVILKEGNNMDYQLFKNLLENNNITLADLLTDESTEEYFKHDFLHYAIIQNDIELIRNIYQDLLNLNATKGNFNFNFNYYDDEIGTPLFFAISKGHTEAVRYLVTQTSTTDITATYRNQNLLAYAMAEGQLPIVKILLEITVDGTPNSPKYFSIEEAKEFVVNNPESIENMVAHGSRADIEYAIEQGFLNPNGVMSDGCNLFLLAAKYAKLDILRFAVEELRMDPDSKTINGESAMYLLATYPLANPGRIRNVTEEQFFDAFNYLCLLNVSIDPNNDGDLLTDIISANTSLPSHVKHRMESCVARAINAGNSFAIQNKPLSP